MRRRRAHRSSCSRRSCVEEVEIAPGLAHLEIYTLRGLLTVLWHGPRDARDVVVTCGGGMGGVLGPADGIYHALGRELASTHGIATMRVGYRKPNDMSRCVHDVAAAADLASRSGARGFVVMGHSFGGAVAVQAGAVLGPHCRGHRDAGDAIRGLRERGGASATRHCCSSTAPRTRSCPRRRARSCR